MKKSIKKNISVGIGILFWGISSSSAMESQVKIGAVIDVQGIHYKTSGDATQRKFSVHNKNRGLYSSGNFLLDYQLVAESGWKYGTKIGLQQTTRNDRGVPFAIYTESEYGKIEAGSDKTAGAKMIITGYSVACAGGNGWDAFIISSPTKGKDGAQVSYVTNLSSFLDAKTRTSKLSDYSRKVSYYTPKFGAEDHKFQLAASYSPDSSNAGHDDIDKANLYEVLSAYPYKFSIKDGVSYGVTYNGKFSDQLSAKVALTGERGKPVAFKKTNNTRANIKFKDLNAYNLGAQITYGQFSVAGSFMNYNKSLSNSTVDIFGTETNIHSIGTRYNFLEGKYSISLNHFHSDHKKNKFDATSLGVESLIGKGIKAYAQFTRFQAKGRYIETGVIKNDKSKGDIVIVGGKISL